MLEIEIDGKKCEAKEGAMVIQVADANGIYIPRFCYHKKLSIAANCRMCLIEVENSRKPLPACATPVCAGMKVFTQSKEALKSQRAVMEFLLINHPLDCPICDQGGECELQDLSMGYGKGISRFTERKRSVARKDIGPLIATYMTRCIHCTRCVRFGDEVAGLPELGAVKRGENMEIGTYVERAVTSELSGNMIDLCPVGALTNKVYEFRGRAWELVQHEMVAPHDCVGSNIYVHTRRQEYETDLLIKRVVPRDNDNVNENWISDRDRYSYEALYSRDRLKEPMMKFEGQWEQVDWPTALFTAMHGLKKFQPDEIGALASPTSTTEELFLLQKIMRGIGCHNIDHRLRQRDFRDWLLSKHYPGLEIPINEIEQLDRIMLVGSNMRHEQPMLNHRVRKAWLQNAKITAINPVDYTFNYELSHQCITHLGQMVSVLAGIAKALRCDKHEKAAKALLADVKASDKEQAIANELQTGERVGVFLGAQAMNHPDASILYALSQLITRTLKGSCHCLTDGPNSTGAWLAGAVPHQTVAGMRVEKTGKNAWQMISDPLPAYLLLNVEPAFDTASAALALKAMQQAELVIAMTPYMTAAIDEHADFVFPMAAFAESPGTYINATGRWQSFKGVNMQYGNVRPAWKILRVLGNILELDNFKYQSCDEVHKEIKAAVNAMPDHGELDWQCSEDKIHSSVTLQRLTHWPMYRNDSLVRRARALQKMIPAGESHIRVHSQTAKRLGLVAGDQVKAIQADSDVVLPLMIDDTIADSQVAIAAAMPETIGFGSAFGDIALEKVSD